MRREFIGLMGKLSCEFEEDGDRLIAELAGKADLHTSRELGKLLAAYLDKGKNEILLDLDNLEYRGPEESPGGGRGAETDKAAETAPGSPSGQRFSEPLRNLRQPPKSPRFFLTRTSSKPRSSH